MSKYGAAIAAAALLLALSSCKRAGGADAQSQLPKSASGYYAVLLNNNQVVYGNLEGLGTAFPVLRNVRFVRTTVDPATKKVSSSLVKRANEAHEPDFMLLNTSQIVIVEPVGPNSRIGAILREDATPR